MSSFICSDKHYKKVKDLTYKLILSDRYILFEFNLDYNLDKELIKNFVNNNIYELYKLNVASYNLQYREKQVNRIYNDYENNIGNDFIESYSNLMSLEELLSLYNAYQCINYQIELKYDRNFVDIVQSHISKAIVRKLNDYYEYQELKNVNFWQFKD